MSNGIRDNGGRARAALDRWTAVSPATRRELASLRRRIEDLEDEVQETRRLHRRVAELTDIIQELLVPLAQRDEDKVREQLERYSASL